MPTKAEQIILQSQLQGTPAIDSEAIYQAARAIKYYNSIDFQKQDLYNKYLDQFLKEETWKKMPKTCYNIVRPIVKTLSRLYTYPVVRRWDDPNSREAKLFSEIEGYDRMMKTVDKYTLLGGTVAVRPTWDDALQRFSFSIYTRDMIEVTADAIDPTLQSQVTLTWNDRGSRIRHIWSAEKFYEEVNGTVTDDKDNIYGEIPLVFFTNEEQPWGVVEGPAQDLVEANLVLNWIFTMLNDIGVLQAAGLLVTKGRDKSTVMRSGPRAYIDLPALPEADAKYINSGADIDKLIAVVNLNLSTFLSTRNIPENAIRAIAKESKSGVALAYEEAAIIDYVNERKVQFGERDAQLAKLSVKVKARHTAGNANFEPKAPSIKYKEFSVPMGGDERDAWQFRIDKNLATPVDILLSENPGMTEKEAEEKIAKNKRTNATIGLTGVKENDMQLDEHNPAAASK